MFCYVLTLVKELMIYLLNFLIGIGSLHSKLLHRLLQDAVARFLQNEKQNCRHFYIETQLFLFSHL